MKIGIREEVIDEAMSKISHALDAYCADHRPEMVRDAIGHVSMLALPQVAEQLALLWRDALYALHEAEEMLGLDDDCDEEDSP